jgi:glycerol-3-phosphate acyltransferase PlsX
MGGDNAPASVIYGADIAKAQTSHVEFIFVGDESQVGPLLKQTQHLQNAEILHTNIAVAAEDTASQAVRRGRDSSMWRAIAKVADKKADAVVSAGNTGALMVR